MQLFLAGAVIFSALLSSARYVCTELKFVLKETSLGHALQSQCDAVCIHNLNNTTRMKVAAQYRNHTTSVSRG